MGQCREVASGLDRVDGKSKSREGIPVEILSIALTVVHLLAVIAWLGGMIFHIVVLDPVFRNNEVSFQSA